MLLKKAIGFEKSEISKEYQIDEEGKETLVRKKVQKKYFPPDMQAMRAYLELEKGEDLSAMSDEELEREKIRLLAELKEKEKGNER